MKYPLGTNTEDYKKNFNTTAGYGYGATTEYGRHDGVDINGNGGGDSDLGQPIYAITNGRLEYYHKGSHPTKNFGYHSVYKIEGPWGTRWVHNAHMMDDFLTGIQDIKEGQQIGRIGKSGTVWAHNHFAIFKVDPTTLRNGIDTIALNKAELDSWWEDPILFIERWIGASTEKMVTLPQKELDEIRTARDQHYNNLQEEKKKVEQLTKDVNSCENHAGELIKQLEKINETDKNTSQQLLACQHDLQPSKNALNRIVVLLGGSFGATPDEIVELVEALKKSKVKQAPKPVTFLEKLKFLFG